MAIRHGYSERPGQREGEAVALSRDYRNGERRSSMLLENRIQPRDHHLVTVQSGRLASHDPQVCRGCPVGMRGHPPKGLSGSWCFRGQINACGMMKGARNTQGRKDVILGDEKHHKVRGNVRIPAMILDIRVWSCLALLKSNHCGNRVRRGVMGRKDLAESCSIASCGQ